MFGKKSLLALSVLFVSSTLYSAPGSPPKGKSKFEDEDILDDTEDEKAPELRQVPTKKNNSFEVRPTLNTKKGSYHLENELELSTRINEKSKISYVQKFNTNLYDSRDKKSIFRKPHFQWKDAYIKFKLDPFWESEGKDTSFSFQERVYIPTASGGNPYPSKVNQGMITASRTYFTVLHKFLSFLEMDFAYIPSFFIYKKDGYASERKRFVNPVYEFAFAQTTYFKISSSLLLAIPWLYRMTKYRNYRDDAILNNRWGHNLATIPELDWQINDTHILGLAFETDNILKADGSGTTWEPSFNNGNLQLMWNVKF